jgi:hypothetical protein
MIGPERSKTERGSERPDMALSAEAHTIFLLEREDMGWVHHYAVSFEDV